MPRAELIKLRDLVSGVELQLKSLSEGGNPPHSVLRAVFQVNNELGRLARTDDSLSRSLTDLQLKMNLVTVELKRGSPTGALAAFRRASESLDRFEMEEIAQEAQKEFISSGGHETH